MTDKDEFNPAALRALLDAATPGPWGAMNIAGRLWCIEQLNGRSVASWCEELGNIREDDARLIVYLRNHAAELLAKVEGVWTLENANSAIRRDLRDMDERYDAMKRERDELLDERDRLRAARDTALAKVAELERLVDETHPSKLNIEFDYKEELRTLNQKLDEARRRASEMHRRAQRAEALLPWDESRWTSIGKVGVALQAVALSRVTDERDEARAAIADLGLKHYEELEDQLAVTRHMRRERNEARAEITRLKAELEDARDALDMARARIEDPEGTPLDRATLIAEVERLRGESLSWRDPLCASCLRGRNAQDGVDHEAERNDAYLAGCNDCGQDML